MQLGYLSDRGNADILKDKLAVLEKMGCDRVVVGQGTSSEAPTKLVAVVIVNLQAGDTLTVYSMEDVASSLSQFLNLVLDLDAREIRFRSLAEEFDTAGKQGTVTKALIQKLHAFEKRAKQIAEAARHRRRAGRPKALSEEEVHEARQLIQQGYGMIDVAGKFRISKATLYRYLNGE